MLDQQSKLKLDILRRFFLNEISSKTKNQKKTNSYFLMYRKLLAPATYWLPRILTKR